MTNIQPHYFIEITTESFKYFVENNKIKCPNAHKLFFDYTKTLTESEKLNILKGLGKILNDEINEYLNVSELWEKFCFATEVLKFKAKSSFKYDLSERQYSQIKGTYLVDFKQSDIDDLFVLAKYQKINKEGINFFNKTQNLFQVRNIFYRQKQSYNNFKATEIILIFKFQEEILCIKHTHSAYWTELLFKNMNCEKPYAIIQIPEFRLVYDIASRTKNHLNLQKLLPKEHLKGDKIQDFQSYFSMVQKEELDFLEECFVPKKQEKNTKNT